MQGPSRVVVGEDALAGVGRQDGGVGGSLLVRPDGLIVEIEEQLVFPDRAADGASKLVLVEKRERDAGLVIEPVVG